MCQRVVHVCLVATQSRKKTRMCVMSVLLCLRGVNHLSEVTFVILLIINSAIEVDLTGQICADSIGYSFYSGIGGQVDFVRGSARSKGGKSIIALPSTARNDTASRIAAHLKEGAGVVTSRGDVHYVATEFGVAYLHGKTVRERCRSLINIAHPKFREELERSARSRNLM